LEFAQLAQARAAAGATIPVHSAQFKDDDGEASDAVAGIQSAGVRGIESGGSAGGRVGGAGGVDAATHGLQGQRSQDAAPKGVEEVKEEVEKRKEERVAKEETKEQQHC